MKATKVEEMASLPMMMPPPLQNPTRLCEEIIGGKKDGMALSYYDSL